MLNGVSLARRKRVNPPSSTTTWRSGETARLLLSAPEGAMLVARPYHDVARFNAAAGHLLAGLQVDRPPGKSKRYLRERRQAS
jgi:hypothetical protein